MRVDRLSQQFLNRVEDFLAFEGFTEGLIRPDSLRELQIFITTALVPPTGDSNHLCIGEFLFQILMV